MVYKKLFVIVVLIVVIFGSVGILYSGRLSSILDLSGDFSKKGEVFCRDSDDGLNYFRKGAVYGKDNSGEIYDNFDFCEDDETLYEWYCKGSSASFERYKCEKGCQSGICVT